ncbi:MAG: protein-export chaperone SecB [Gammaproteobacteria bacterium]|jgi:preprotein translocase subunit SecB|nr:protein-export chaperone SecB [Gammaproteobacteria bacterium]MBT4605824.1 protein-export chaperone SecB [Thiotrichales bacterium]MBT3471661.1 protein-export chaperone SecB [Gammaproteobacteria bacterium]MBT3967817.1 protein-export chaperone SecB [Gammaproteobacteria bacterium]MBT4080202.1 protein-export chaperone SecB [Gammaproteobacteria bacterium]
MSEEAQNEAPQTTFDIQKIYLKDVSFESPNAPAVFQIQWAPDTNLQVGAKNTKLADDVYEVVLNLTATVKVEEQTAFLIEVQQAGIFTLAGFEEGAMGHLLGAYCPNVLFPYAREAISDLTTKGGFPPLLLAPINFDALYAQNQQAETAEEETKH